MQRDELAKRRISKVQIPTVIDNTKNVDAVAILRKNNQVCPLRPPVSSVFALSCWHPRSLSCISLLIAAVSSL